MRKINLKDLELTPFGGKSGDSETALHGHVQIGTQSFHVEAIQVTEDTAGELIAVDLGFTGELESVKDLSGAALSTQEINGKPYVLVAYPFAR